MRIMAMKSNDALSRDPSAEAGFTLVEALVAMVVIVIGLLAVANLMVVAGTSNSVANQSTAAAAQASEVLERLKAVPFAALKTAQTGTVVGDLVADAGSVANCNDDTQAGGCVIAGNFNSQRSIPGVGIVKTRWTVSQAPDNQSLFIRVRSEGLGSIGRARTRAEFTTFRSCTDASAGC
jgi:type IV pilus modification protein PilV